MKDLSMKEVTRKMNNMTVRGTTDLAECLRCLTVIFHDAGYTGEEIVQTLLNHPNLPDVQPIKEFI